MSTLARSIACCHAINHLGESIETVYDREWTEEVRRLNQHASVATVNLEGVAVVTIKIYTSGRAPEVIGCDVLALVESSDADAIADEYLACDEIGEPIEFKDDLVRAPLAI